MLNFISLQSGLGIFQLEQYKPIRFLNWALNNYFYLKARVRPRLVWTPKAKLIYRLALFLGFLAILLVWIEVDFLAALITLILLSFNNYILILLAWAIIRPYEIYNRIRVKNFIREKVNSIPGLNRIAITGSFGKTSTKLILAELLTDCLATPLSYNTLFGIYKVVDYELSDQFKSFVCEMGAYKIGDIEEFCNLIKPNLSILTGINETHYERFGNIENTIKAKFEVLESLDQDSFGIVNLDNINVRKGLDQKFVAKIIGVTLDNLNHPNCSEIAQLTNIKLEDGRTKFTLTFREKSYDFSMSLIGRAHVKNSAVALVTALVLGEKYEELAFRLANCKQLENRLEFRQNGSVKILNNTYSSNPDSFRENLLTLSEFTGYKVLVSPGMVEMGNKEFETHFEIGKKAASICNQIILVGKNDRTKAILEGAKSVNFDLKKVHFLTVSQEVPAKLLTFGNSSMTVLFENVSDLPAQYL